MVEERSLSSTPASFSLTASPQRWGILPTKEFWKSRYHLKPIRLSLGILTAVTVVAVGTSGVNILWAGPVAWGILHLAQGLIERGVRKAIAARRARYDELQKRLASGEGAQSLE